MSEHLKQQRKLRTGEYVLNRGADNEIERADCRATLRRNGCRSVRFETFENGLLCAHGYLARIEGQQEIEPL